MTPMRVEVPWTRVKSKRTSFPVMSRRKRPRSWVGLLAATLQYTIPPTPQKCSCLRGNMLTKWSTKRPLHISITFPSCLLPVASMLRMMDRRLAAMLAIEDEISPSELPTWPYCRVPCLAILATGPSQGPTVVSLRSTRPPMHHLPMVT